MTPKEEATEGYCTHQYSYFRTYRETLLLSSGYLIQKPIETFAAKRLGPPMRRLYPLNFWTAKSPGEISSSLRIPNIFHHRHKTTGSQKNTSTH